MDSQFETVESYHEFLNQMESSQFHDDFIVLSTSNPDLGSSHQLPLHYSSRDLARSSPSSASPALGSSVCCKNIRSSSSSPPIPTKSQPTSISTSQSPSNQVKLNLDLDINYYYDKLTGIGTANWSSVLPPSPQPRYTSLPPSASPQPRYTSLPPSASPQPRYSIQHADRFRYRPDLHLFDNDFRAGIDPLDLFRSLTDGHQIGPDPTTNSSIPIDSNSTAQVPNPGSSPTLPEGFLNVDIHASDFYDYVDDYDDLDDDDDDQDFDEIDYEQPANLVCPGLFPRMNVNDEETFLPFDVLPLNPSYVE